jgi:osmotically-inducible protein OsmY
MQNKRQEQQQYNGHRHQSSTFKGSHSSGFSSRDPDEDVTRDDNTADRSGRSSESSLQYGRNDDQSDYSRPYSSESSYLGHDKGSGFSSNNGLRSEYSSQRDTLSSYPHQTSYGQGQYSAVNYTDRGLSRKEGYGQYPQQNWKNTNEAQWQTSPANSSSQSRWSSQESAPSKSFFGKGPKGFKRSDERIKEEVCEALFHDHHIDASEIDVTVQNGDITLSGTVTERRMKRLAEDCVESVSGVTDVKNEIKVQSSTSDKSSFGSDDATFADKNMDRNDKTKNRTGSSNKVM